MIGDLGFELTTGVCDDVCARLRALRQQAGDRKRATQGPAERLGDRAGQDLGAVHGHVWRARTLASTAGRILGQLDSPYPCAARQTLACDADLRLPRERFRVFYGAFDWHSCVHAHWSLVRLLADGCLEDRPSEAKRLGHGDRPDRPSGPGLCERVVTRLEESFDADALAQEARTWAEAIPDHEERPYGHTWLLALDAELARTSGQPDGPLARQALRWRDALAPMAREMARRTTAWIAGLSLPTRSGIHSDSAWSLAMAWDWATCPGVRDGRLADAVGAATRRLFAADVAAPVAYEPQGDTFTSPILNEAALMARVLDVDEYEAWLRGFLPQAFAPGEPAAPLLPDPPRGWDGRDYLGVHLVALPLSRALAARDAAAPLPVGSPARAHLAAGAHHWALEGLWEVPADGGHLADHWVGTFVAATLAGPVHGGPKEPARA